MDDPITPELQGASSDASRTCAEGVPLPCAVFHAPTPAAPGRSGPAFQRVRVPLAREDVLSLSSRGDARLADAQVTGDAQVTCHRPPWVKPMTSSGANTKSGNGQSSAFLKETCYITYVN